MIATKIKTKPNTIEYDDNLVTVVLIKTNPICEAKIAGKSVLDWTKSAVNMFHVIISESTEDYLSIAKQVSTKSQYIFVMPAQHPLLLKKDVMEMVDYIVYKNLTHAKFACGEIFLVEALPKMDQVTDIFMVPIAVDRCAKIENEVTMGAYSAIIQNRIITYHMEQGVRVIDPKTTFIDSNVIIGNGVTLAPFVSLINGTVVGDHCFIDSFSIIDHSTLMPNSRVNSSHLQNVVVHSFVTVDPYQHLHDCELESNQDQVKH